MSAWQPLPLTLPINSGEVHIVAAKTSEAAAKRWQHVLSSDEHARAARFYTEQLQHRFIAAHALLRLALSACTSMRPEALKFQTSAEGKPFLASTETLQFNLSHSDDHVMLAITRGAAIGVDIECIRHRDVDGLITRFFSPDEQAQFENLATDARIAMFYQIWVQKEAYIKALGTGLRTALSSFSVRAEPPGLITTHHLDTPWTLQYVPWQPDAAAAFAVQAHVQAIYYWKSDMGM